MKQETYDAVLEVLSRTTFFSHGLTELQKKFPHILETVSEKTLRSIQAQYYVRRMRRCHHHHYSKDTREKYYQLYKEAKSHGEENVIVRIAAKNDISPCLLARIILEEYYWNDVDHNRTKERSDGRASLPPGFMTDCIRNIAKLPNPFLARELYETMVVDNFYGPVVDSIKKSCGVEYEIILRTHCQQAGLSFIDEGQMRKYGYDKTPDIKLKLPISINGTVVNWIESKASFGDPINHQQYMIDQFLPYRNRFGHGAVIYWFGFVDELAEQCDHGILLLDKFPDTKDIIYLEKAKQEDEKAHQEESGASKSLLFSEECWMSTVDIINSSDNYLSNYIDPIFDSDEES